MEGNRPPVARWCFTVNADGSWSLRRVRAGGTVEPISGPHGDFGKAVADALRIGFDPERHTWAVEQRHWVTHYEPGAKPVTIPRTAFEEAMAHQDDPALP